MSKVGIELRIDVMKIDKDRLYEGQGGAKYLTATAWVDSSTADKYGFHGMVTMKQTKEERESKTYTPIIGNSKMFWNDDNSLIAKGGQSVQQAQQQQAPVAQQAPVEFDDDIPF